MNVFFSKNKAQNELSTLMEDKNFLFSILVDNSFKQHKNISISKGQLFSESTFSLNSVDRFMIP